MGVSSGIFNIIQRGQINATASHLRASYQASQRQAEQANKNQIDKSQLDRGLAGKSQAPNTNPLTWSLKRNESAIAAHWRLAPESAAKTAPSLETVKRLEEMADGDNSDIAAEKMRQAKVKLDGLRRQLQMLAASGDVRQLRRIAAEAASLAREIGVAARSIAQGIGAGTVSSDASGAQATASAANAAAQAAPGSAPESARGSAPAAAGTEDTAAADSAGGDTLAQSFKALHELGNEARNAVAQAKGIIALAAQIARSKRRGGDDEEDRYFRRLQEEVDAAFDDIDAGQREALAQLVQPQEGGIGGSSDSGSDGVIFTSTTLSVTVETLVIATSEARVEVYA